MISIDKARNFIYSNGNMWEKALWSYLFDNGSLERAHQYLLCYKNEDKGWGHGLEHDIKSPLSNPLMLEFLLTVVRDTNLPIVKTFVVFLLGICNALDKFISNVKNMQHLRDVIESGRANGMGHVS